jgi:hypothetical protein
MGATAAIDGLEINRFHHDQSDQESTKGNRLQKKETGYKLNFEL